MHMQQPCAGLPSQQPAAQAKAKAKVQPKRKAQPKAGVTAAQPKTVDDIKLEMGSLHCPYSYVFYFCDFTVWL